MGRLKKGIFSETTLCRIENGIEDLAMADRMREFIANFHEELLNNGNHGAVLFQGRWRRRGVSRYSTE